MRIYCRIVSDANLWTKLLRKMLLGPVLSHNQLLSTQTVLTVELTVMIVAFRTFVYPNGFLAGRVSITCNKTTWQCIITCQLSSK